jgi:hypothetical protein
VSLEIEKGQQVRLLHLTRWQNSSRAWKEQDWPALCHVPTTPRFVFFFSFLLELKENNNRTAHDYKVKLSSPGSKYFIQHPHKGLLIIIDFESLSETARHGGERARRRCR